MSHQLAQVIVSAFSTDREDAILALLNPDQFAVQVVAAEDVRKKAREGRPDLILVDVAPDLDKAIDLCTELKNHPETSEVPMVMVGDEASAPPVGLAIELGAADLVVDVVEPAAMTMRLLPLLRLSTMKAELRRRLTTAAGFGLFLDPNQDLDIDDDPYSVLIVAADPTPIKETVKGGLENHCRLQTVTDAFAGENALREKRYDACIVVEDQAGLTRDALLELAERIRMNPSLFNLPVLALIDAGEDHQAYYQRGVSRALDREIDAEDLGGVITTLVNRQRLRWRIRQSMDEALDPMTLEPSGAFHQDFFQSHLSRMIADAHEGHKPLAVMAFATPTVAEVEEDFSSEAAHHLVRQLAAWINTMTRVEDVIGQQGEDHFFVALPDTPEDDARFVMNRVAGVLSQTDFALYDVYRPITVDLKQSLALLAPGDGPEELFNKAQDGLKA